MWQVIVQVRIHKQVLQAPPVLRRCSSAPYVPLRASGSESVPAMVFHLYSI